MSESTLNLSIDDLRSETGAFLGWGRDKTKWSSRKQDDIKACVETALRKFYFQAQPDPRDPNHKWTFLRPVADITLAISTDTTSLDHGYPVAALATLPDDFGGFEGEASVSQVGLSGGFWPLKIVSEEMIRVKYAAFPVISGRPVAIAERQVRGTNINRSNRSDLVVYPLPDNPYTLHVPYYILPNYLTSDYPYPYGGAAHAETMKAACRAAAELFMDNSPGPENANYSQCLKASIQYDRRHQPKSLGINSDTSDMIGMWRGHWPDGLWHPLGIGFLSEATYG